MKDPLDDALGLPPMPRKEPEIIVPHPTAGEEDYEFARRNLYRMIAKMENHLDELGDIALVSQHPRAFEVYSNLAKATVDANKELLALKKTNQEITGVGVDSGPRSVTQNLIMTSDEVLRMLKGEKK